MRVASCLLLFNPFCLAHTSNTPPTRKSPLNNVRGRQECQLLSYTGSSAKILSDKAQSTSGKQFALASPKPESPTTARPLDFDDEPQEPGTAATATFPGAPLNDLESAPPKPPPRPLSPRQQTENTLIEAFPSVDVAVVRAVLMASSWEVEPAFHALLCGLNPRRAIWAAINPQLQV